MAGLTSCVPVTVTAHLQQGIVVDTLFGTAFDGLLASETRARAKAETSSITGTVVTGSMLDGGLHATKPAVVDLPLARCGSEDDEDWHWMCTTAYPVSLDGQPTSGDHDVHHQHSRVRDRNLGTIIDRIPASIPPASGRYRLRRMPVVSTPASAVIWQAVGDPDAIADLLSGIVAIGRRRGTGEGTVLRWDITQAQDADPHLHGHCHPNGHLGRPTPRRCVKQPVSATDRTGVAGIRPPYWHPATQYPVLLPEPLQGTL